MKTILDYIKEYPEEFIASAERRADTTPSELNRKNHYKFTKCIYKGDWAGLKELLSDEEYTKPLEGVILCLNQYTDLDINICIVIHNNFKEGNLL